MISCGSSSFGETGMPPLQRVRGKGSLFSNSRARLCCRRRHRQTTCRCLPAEQPGSSAPQSGFEAGFGARSGSTRAGEQRKVQCPARDVPCPSTEEKLKILPSLQLYQGLARPLSLSLSPPKSLPRTGAKAAPPAPAPARLPADPPLRTAAAHPRAGASGMLRAQRRRGPAAASGFRGGGFQPRRQPRARAPAPAPRSALRT